MQQGSNLLIKVAPLQRRMALNIRKVSVQDVCYCFRDNFTNF